MQYVDVQTEMPLAHSQMCHKFTILPAIQRENDDREWRGGVEEDRRTPQVVLGGGMQKWFIILNNWMA